MVQQGILGHLLERVFPHGQEESELMRLRQMHARCECAKPCPNKVSFFDKMHHRGRSLNLIAYVRACESEAAQQQLAKIQQFCADRGHHIVQVFDHDTMTPERGLREALDALNFADGMIVCDLTRLVKHHGDPLRELGPIVHHYFFHEPKHLISISECIDTTSIEGQEQLVEILKQIGDIEYGTC